MAKQEKISKTKIKTFLLEIPEDTWMRWKETVPRSISLNTALIELLDTEAKKREK